MLRSVSEKRAPAQLSPVPAEHAGERVRRWRHAAHLSQMKLARLAGVSPATITRCELAAVLTPATAARIAAVVGCTAEQLLEPEPSPRGVRS